MWCIGEPTAQAPFSCMAPKVLDELAALYKCDLLRLRTQDYELTPDAVVCQTCIKLLNVLLSAVCSAT